VSILTDIFGYYIAPSHCHYKRINLRTNSKPSTATRRCNRLPTHKHSSSAFHSKPSDPQSNAKMGSKPTSDANTPTKTHWIFEQLRFVNTRARSLYAEQIRALIRPSGLTSVKDSNSLCLQYYILFVDETTMKHFAQFQGMWTYRNDREVEYHEW